MTAGRVFGVMVAAIATLSVAACSATPTPSPPVTIPPAYTPVVVSQLGAPTFPFKGSDGKFHIAYDLQLTNAANVAATI